MLKKLYPLGRFDVMYHFLSRIRPWVGLTGTLLFGWVIWQSLWQVPPDYQQGDAFRIIYLHVPLAFYSMGFYLFMAINALVFLVWRIKLAGVMIRASATIGAIITFLALLTGSLWGKPMWGTWWIWDARLTSELILFFLFLGVIALQNATPNTDQAKKLSAILALIGAIDLPIIHFSVIFWHTLHQGPTLSRFGKPTMAPEMLWPLLWSLLAFFLILSALWMYQLQCLILKECQHQRWVKSL